ncbi:MAG TPA: hypothetical protein VGD67_03945 [Pseudonocardiaceae bacterium]
MSWFSDLLFDADSGLDKASQGVKLSVNQDNVMQAARLVKAESEYFRSRVVYWSSVMNESEPMGGDPVSENLHEALQNKLYGEPGSYIDRCYEYADMLDRLATQLGESAKLYGFTDEQVAAQFAAGRIDAEARPVSPPPGRYGHLREV